MSEQPYIDWQRAREVLGLLLEAIRTRSYPYQNLEDSLPQNLIPAHIRANRALCAAILFYSCHWMRGTIRSAHAMRRTLWLHDVRPQMLNPRLAMHMPLEAIEHWLRLALPYKVKEVARNWKENSKRAVTHWDGDFLRIVETALEPDDIYRFFTNRSTTKNVVAKGPHAREDGFLGFQKKMGSLMVYFLAAHGLISGTVAEKISSPIDFHNVRVFVATGMIRIPPHLTRARYEQLQPLGIEIVEQYLRTSNATMRELCDAVWLLSVLLCGRSPSTYSNQGRWKPIDWQHGSRLERYAATCGACPVEGHCTKAIQTYMYYEQGLFELDRPREKPSLAAPLPLVLPHVMPRRRQLRTKQSSAPRKNPHLWEPGP